MAQIQEGSTTREAITDKQIQDLKGDYGKLRENYPHLSEILDSMESHSERVLAAAYFSDVLIGILLAVIGALLEYGDRNTKNFINQFQGVVLDSVKNYQDAEERSVFYLSSLRGAISYSEMKKNKEEQ